MKTTQPKFMYIAIACFLTVAGLTGSGWAQSQTDGNSGSGGLQQRIDFGNSYIMGQSIKSGAVYLLHRKQSEIKSMLHYREHYREEILEDFKIRNLNVEDTQAENQNAAEPRKAAARK